MKTGTRERTQKTEGIKKQFVSWVEKKTGQPFSISNNIQLACLDEAIEQIITNDRHYTHDLQMKKILEAWVSNVTILLAQPVKKDIFYRGIRISSHKYEELKLYLLDDVRNINLRCAGFNSI